MFTNVTNILRLIDGFVTQYKNVYYFISNEPTYGDDLVFIEKMHIDYKRNINGENINFEKAVVCKNQDIAKLFINKSNVQIDIDGDFIAERYISSNNFIYTKNQYIDILSHMGFYETKKFIKPFIYTT